MKRRVVLVLAFLAAAPTFAAESWIEIKGPSLTVVSDAGDKEARRVLSQFEQVRALLRESWPGAKLDPTRPVTLVAVKDADEYSQFVPSSLETSGTYAAGMFLSAPDRNWGVLRTDTSRFDENEDTWVNPYHAALHEYVHMLERLNFEQLPAWLEEGLAEFWANSIVDGDRVFVGRAVTAHVWTLRERTRIPLLKLLAIPRGSNELSDKDRATVPFAQAWALVHLLTVGAEARRGQLARFTELVRSGRPAAEAASEAFGDLAALERELDAYARKDAFAPRRRPAVAEARGEPRELPAAEALALRAELLSAVGRGAEAASMAAEALRLDAGLAAAYEAKGLVAWRAQRSDEARQALERAIQLPNASAFAHLLYGQLVWDTLKGKAGLDRVEREFQRAADLEPAFAQAYESLALVKEASGAPYDQVLPLAVRASALEPGNLALRVTMLRLTARSGQVAQARAQADRLLGWAQGDERKKVEALIEEISDPKRLPPETACANGYGAACDLLGTQYRDGNGVVKNPAKAVAYFQKGCAAGHPGSCSSLGFAYEGGTGVEKDLTKAIPLYRKACEGGHRWSCTRLAFALASGDGVAADPVEAAALLEKSCAGDDAMACAKLGSMLRVGEGVPVDMRRAEALLRGACGKGSSWGCGELAGLLVARGAVQDMPEAVRLLESACENDAPGFCAMLAGVLELGHGVARGPARAATLYRKACDRGYAPACAKAGR
jgi:TPR repeat protein